MIITVDSNVLLSVFIKDSIYEQSKTLLEKYSASEFVINDCIYMELGVNFGSFKRLDDALKILEVKLINQPDIDHKLILKAWIQYLNNKIFICPSCKNSITPVCPNCRTNQPFRQRILADFIIGSFASANSHGIITLDPAYYRNYFPELAMLE